MGTIVDVTGPDPEKRRKTTVVETLSENSNKTMLKKSFINRLPVPEELGSAPEGSPSAGNSADVKQKAQDIPEKRERSRQEIEARKSAEKKQNEDADGIDMTDFVNEILHSGSEDNIGWDFNSDSEHNTDVEGNSSSDGGDGGNSDEAGDNIPDKRGLPKLVHNEAFWDRPVKRAHEYDHIPENILKGCIWEEDLYPNRKFLSYAQAKLFAILLLPKWEGAM